MAGERKVIRIESILGGHAPMTHFAGEDQFRASIGIDPSLPIDDDEGVESVYACGLLRPTSAQPVQTEALTDEPMWILSTPQDNVSYVYGHRGSIYTVSSSAITGIGTLNEVTDTYPQGMGAAYYDNYLYFATQTNVARYGPLNGTPVFTKSYWVSTLGKTALVENSYPNDNTLGIRYPNHVMHRHSDGRLYFGDTVDNKGVLHYISTTKTTVEGDTDNGSTYNALEFGYNLVPTAIETYGSDLVIALMEKRSGNFYNGDSKTGAKIAFWDTTSSNLNRIIWNAFPDGFISALKNINGVLYIVSGPFNGSGFRVSRYIGGDSVEEVFYSEAGQAPFPGAVDGDSSRLVFGSNTAVPETTGCVWSYNTQKHGVGLGIHNIQRITASSSTGLVTALALENSTSFQFNVPEYVGWTVGDTVGAGYHGIDKSSTEYGHSAQVWWSQMYRVGQKFKITKIRIPLAAFVSTNMSIVPKVYVDDLYNNTSGELTEINPTNYNNARVVNYRSYATGKDIVGENNFWLELRWEGSALLTVGLPIIIEYELFDD